MSAQKINLTDSQVREVAPRQSPGRRICRTPEEAFRAGWDDGAGDPPLTPTQVTRLAALLGPSIRDFLDSADQQPGNAA